MRTIYPLLLAKKIPFTYSTQQVVSLTSQIPQRYFPKCRSSQQGKTQNGLHVRAKWSRASEPDIDVAESANQVFSSGNIGPQKRVARIGQDKKLMRFFFDLFCEVFPKRKYIFLKRKCFYLENICETKVILFLKRKYFNLQTKVEVFPKRK